MSFAGRHDFHYFVIASTSISETLDTLWNTYVSCFNEQNLRSIYKRIIWNRIVWSVQYQYNSVCVWHP